MGEGVGEVQHSEPDPDLLRAQAACPPGGRACGVQQVYGANSAGGLRGGHGRPVGHSVVLCQVPGGVLPSRWHEPDVPDEPSGSSNAFICKPNNVAKFAAQYFANHCPEVAAALESSISEKIRKLEEADAQLLKKARVA